MGLVYGSAITAVIAVVVTVVALIRSRRRQSTPVQADHSVTPQNKKQLYRLPTGVFKTIETAIGDVRLVTASGYFSGTAIFVYLPDGFYFPNEFREAFRKATGGKFHMDRTSSSSGGDSTASATITAGLDWDAYSDGKQGYFKMSSAPKLDEMATLLSSLIDHPMRDSGGGVLPRTSRTSSAAA